MAEIEQADLTTLTVELLSAFVSNNTIDSGDLAGLIQSTHTALAGINAPAPVEPPAPEYEPAVTVRKSLGSREHILSLIDGKPYKTLKRHLSGHGLTPAEYRERYKLPADYPMVAPSYSEHRREVAQRLGLGRKSTKVAEPVAELPAKTLVPAAEATAPTVGKVKAPRKATTKPDATKVAASAKAPKPATKRAAKVTAPAPAVVDAAPESDTVEASAIPAVVEPKPTKKAAVAKPAATKAKSAASAESKVKPTTAKRGRPKAAAAAAPTE
jgi:predicted transcriptional regulator